MMVCHYCITSRFSVAKIALTWACGGERGNSRCFTLFILPPARGLKRS